MQRGSLLPRSIDHLVHLVQRLADALERQVELVVRRVEILEDRLEGRIGVDIVPDADEQAVGDIHDDRHLVQVVADG